VPAPDRAAAFRLARRGDRACERSPRAIAEVAGRRITLEELDEVVVAQTGQPLAEVPPELADALLGRHLEEEVLLAAGGEPRDRNCRPPCAGPDPRAARPVVPAAAAAERGRDRQRDDGDGRAR